MLVSNSWKVSSVQCRAMVCMSRAHLSAVAICDWKLSRNLRHTAEAEHLRLHADIFHLHSQVRANIQRDITILDLFVAVSSAVSEQLQVSS